MLVNFYSYNEKVIAYMLSFHDESVFDELEPFIEERYEKFAVTSTMKAFMNALSLEEASLVVALSEIDNGFTVLYTNPETLMVPDINDVSALMTRLDLVISENKKEIKPVH